MSRPVAECPKCTAGTVYAKLHCQESPTCTWSKCWKCGTTFDRYRGTFQAVTT